MSTLRGLALGIGWAGLALLAFLAARQGVGPHPFAAGGWLGSLVALAVLGAVLVPDQAVRAIPAAGFAVLAGGVVFSTLAEVDGLTPGRWLMVGSASAAALAALLCLGGAPLSRRVTAGLIAAALHAGLLQVLTPPGMTPALALWPWAPVALALAWGGAAALAR